MIQTNDKAYSGKWDRIFNTDRFREYSREEVEKIIRTGSLDAQRALSNNYFNKNGFYKRIIIYYATLLKYVGILIPVPAYDKKMTDKSLEKRYYSALDFIERNNVKNFCYNCALKAFINGAYYGVILKLDKKGMVVLDLPSGYCRSRFKDFQDRDIVEFNVKYFDSIADESDRKKALSSYPKFIAKAYEKYQKDKVESQWVYIPADFGICFSLYGNSEGSGTPLFLDVIPATIDYDDAVDLEKERDLEEIRKILVQKIPHLSDGTLLFEPPEAQEMHNGAVGMLRKNGNISVLTTYGDVDAIITKTSSEATTNNLEKMKEQIYSNLGTSSQLFSSTSTSTLEISIKNDLSLVMPLVNKFSIFYTNIVNFLFENSKIKFKYELLPVSYYNEEELLDTHFKMASSGYSFLMPAVVMGISQRDLGNIKTLENDVLKLGEKLIPLATSFTQAGNGEGGAPKKSAEDKAPKTIQNEESLDKQGVTNNG
jgi:hypothetical protein